MLPGRPGRAGESVDPPHRLHAAAGVPRDVAQRVQHGVGAARGQLQAQVPAALSRVQVVVGERGHRGQQGRLAPSQAVAVVEQRGAHPDRDGQPVRDHGRAEHPGVRRRGAGARGRRGAARGQEPGPAGQRAQQLGQLTAAVRGDSARHHQGLPLRLGHDAGLVHAVERDRGQPAEPAVLAERLAGRGGLRGPVGVPAGRPGQHAADRTGHPGAQRAAQERAAWRRPGRGAQPGGGIRPGRSVRFSRRLTWAVLARVTGCGHHDLRGSVMTAIGARSSSTWLAAASICSRRVRLSWLTGIQLPSGRCSAGSRVRSRFSQVYTADSPR